MTLIKIGFQKIFGKFVFASFRIAVDFQKIVVLCNHFKDSKCQYYLKYFYTIIFG